MRLLNRPLAFILAAALAVASIIVIIEVIAFHINSGPLVLHWTTWYHWAAKTHWNAAGGPSLVSHPDPHRRARSSCWSSSPAASPACGCIPADDATDAAVTRGGLAGTLRGGDDRS